MSFSRKKIVIIGKKKVGKSSLFNFLCKNYQEKSDNFFNLKNTPEINYYEDLINIENNGYRIIDTPSFEFKESEDDLIKKKIFQVINKLITEGDLILLMTDLKNGLEEKEENLTKFLLKKKINFILVGNKLDLVRENNYFNHFFYSKKYESCLISANTNKNIDKLVKKITNNIPSVFQEEKKSDKSLNLLIFGPPNSGKSTLMNYLLGEERSLATNIAGTTKEPVLGNFELNKINFKLVDTAGLMKKQDLSFFLWKQIDIAWIIIDATEELTKQISQIIHLAEKHKKPLVIVINKLDLLPSLKQNNLKKDINERLKSLKFCPIIYISALIGTNIKKLITITREMFNKSETNISKKKMEMLVKGMTEKNPPNFWNGGKLKIYYAKQEKKGLVPTFIFFVNDRKFLHFSYQRYINNYLRESLNIKTLPINTFFKKSD